MQVSVEFKDYEYERYLGRVKFYVISFLGATFILFFILLGVARANDFSQYSNEQIVEAIGKAENSVKYPYGIKSIDTKGNVEYARQICLNSVTNGRKRWIKAGKPYDLISFLGLRYCPPKAHQLNSNWVRNVKYFLERKK